MLDVETKARIDSARDILVGKVPDPKSQVEQITIALIYKFMDDMDCQSEELGGKASFFTGEFKKYRWANLLDRRLGGYERLLLYAEGIEKMNVNKKIPQLFRDIFRGVFLPYRDPETLNLFLKEIDGFAYDHSERLGDAYEYLLNVLGTQGDAGQFRTPRHIIDFIVAVVDPKKHETVLDPACGTAGFLVSAFKHILRTNENLTPDERARLMTNFRGYDIAPDMVRLSRVNMYLHGFPNPVIHEYDTLTSEERWDERSDVIMANPPFMTPKGGIRPHNRFSIKARRSEVLFVDYIAEHLSPGGRAGVIVPEGIIFQSQNAYKSLRRMLLEDYLWAVVSLPAGVFNPYSGVKTSILFLDRNLAKRTDEVQFVKVENDGFDLGAQRRPIEKNDLPEAFRVLKDWKDKTAMPAVPEETNAAEKGLFLSVVRKRLLESPDINLSGDRYRPVAIRASGRWPRVELREISKISAGDGAPQDNKCFFKGTMPFFRTSDVGAVHITSDLRESRDLLTEAAIKDKKLTVWPPKTILFPKSGASTFLNHRVMLGRSGVVSSHLAIIVANESRVLSGFLFHLLCYVDARSLTEDQNYPSLRLGDLGRIEIPLPPLEEQERIVAELEGYRKVIDGARQVIDSYKPTIRIDPAWSIKKVVELCELVRGSSPRPKSDPQYYGGKLPRLLVADLTRDGMYVTPQIDFLTEEGARHSRLMKRNEIVMAVSGNPGLPAVLNIDAYIHDGFVGFRELNDCLLPGFLYYALSYFKERSDSQSIGAVFKNLTTDQIKDFDIPVPPLDVQRKIVAEMDTERKLVQSNQDLIARMEAKIRAKLAEVWGDSDDAA